MYQKSCVISAAVNKSGRQRDKLALVQKRKVLRMDREHALTWIRYKDDDGLVHPPPHPQQQCPQLPTQIPALVASIHPSRQTTTTSTPLPNSSRSSPHHTIHPQKFLFYIARTPVQTMSRGVVPQSTGRQPCPPTRRRRLRPPMRQRLLSCQVSSISPSINPMAVGRGHMDSYSTTQSNFCPCEVSTPFECSHMMLIRRQRALNALLPSTAGLSLVKKSSISAESKHHKHYDTTQADMQLRWKTSKQKEWYGFYSEVSPLHSKLNLWPTPLFVACPIQVRTIPPAPSRRRCSPRHRCPCHARNSVHHYGNAPLLVLDRVLSEYASCIEGESDSRVREDPCTGGPSRRSRATAYAHRRRRQDHDHRLWDEQGD